ncbi:alpha/beta fold hydrolase [Frigidibacter oleivorans]|uniref:alpha/beta fold hydrolase n=1 Tax=Frigidibacter oleivorans TaxID=2487129 RepID=UPI000F8F35BF|nr:alpha/beta fold hydrolase [Frigidibacter oleivorans]
MTLAPTLAPTLPAADALACHRLGQGPRPGVAVHCSLANAFAWGPLMQIMASDLTVEAIDLPGHGASPDWTADQGGFAEVAVAGALARLDAAEGPVDLIGHSFGALAALGAALARPGAVRSLTLIEPVLFAALRDSPDWDAYRAAMAGFATAWEAGDREAAARAFMAVWGNGAAWEDLPLPQRAAFARRIHLILAILPANEGDSLGLLRPGGLESLTMPVLLVEGARSPASIPAVLDRLQARLPQATRAVVPEAGHMLPLTHPAALAGLLRDLFSRG